MKGRDRRAWEQLVSEQHGPVFRMLCRLTGDREAAADLTQEAFVAAYRSAQSFNGRAQPGTWLHGVALNCYRSWRRKRGEHDPPEALPDDLPDPSPSAEELALLHEQSALLARAVQQLPDLYRRVVALRYYAGMAATEIAQLEGVDAGTIRWRMHQAHKQLWCTLAPQLGKDDEQ